mmetsp:Transcript_79852/g.234888  ORF Transcript_79852/g.234888 Transcript_79852/m.234888 type:complete len:305 (+) Transcript_79852:385-1299(+)
MLAVKVGGLGRAEEELGAVGVRPGVGHGQREGAVVLERTVELVLELASPDALATGAVALGVSGLDHEALDDAVEDGVVVVAVLRVHREVLHALWGFLEEQLDHNVSHRGVDRGLLAQWVLGPDGRGHGGILFRGLLVEDVAAIVGRGLWRFTRAENEEALLLVGGANGKRVRYLLAVVRALHHGRAQLHLLLLGLRLEHGHSEEPLRLLHFAQHAHQLVRVDVHDLDPDHGGVYQEVARLVEDGLLIHHRGRLPHFLLHRNATTKVESIQVQVCHVGVTLRSSEHLQRLVVCPDHLGRGEAEDP